MIDTADRDSARADAARLEELGYGTIWVSGGQLQAGLEPLTRLLEATERIRVGSAVAMVELHPAAALAERYAAAPDRMVAGIGGGHGPHPLRTLNAYLDELDGTAPVPERDRILAALGPRKLDLAARRSAGALTTLNTPEYTAWARDRLGTGATLIVQQLAAIGLEPDQARERAREPLRFLSGITGYPENFARMGFTEREITGLEDSLVDRLVAHGDVDTVAERMRAHLDAGADQVIYSGLGPDPERHEHWRQLIERL